MCYGHKKNNYTENIEKILYLKEFVTPGKRFMFTLILFSVSVLEQICDA